MSDTHKHPNVVFVFCDQLRQSATSLAGDPNISTPNLERMASQGVNFTMAVSGWPVCSPARATLLSGQYPLTHGVFVNDVPLNSDCTYLGDAFKVAGYDTAYIGKWHVNAGGRSNPIPRERQRGFDYWRVLECTHSYNESKYYSDNDPTPRVWDGYDATAQTQDAQQYIVDHSQSDKPFMLVLSWGPPHNPYQTAPKAYRDRFDPAKIELRPNVPSEHQEQARRDLVGYYAHTAALDDLLGDLMDTLESQGIADNTLLVFWSDHGDMIGSQGQQRKQRPWDESIRVPLVMRCPRLFGTTAQQINTPITTLDLMPTLLGLSGNGVPVTCEGVNYTPHIREGAPAPTDAALIACFHPFGEYERGNGGREYRGVRTRRHTYARTLDGPWLLFDNEADPYQLHNLVNDPAHTATQRELEARLQRLLDARDDKFEPGDVYIKRWGYITDERGTVPYRG